MPGTRTITVRYFALFREQSRLGTETLATASTTPGELYAELATRHRFTLSINLVRAAVNREFRPMDSALADGDEVVFVPPVAGG